jgi:ribosome-binding protein aMBF1 (putative translation factor)
MNCQVCGNETDALFLIGVGNGGMINVCRACKKLTPIERYNNLIRRHDEVLERARVEYGLCYRNQDRKAMDKMQSVIDRMEKSKRELWKPS